MYQRILLVIALFAALADGPSLFGQNGIFADFTTSMGSFTCRLEYATSPKAVANFIGLATGQRRWLDLPTGLARTNAFYNGLIFHRVVAGFIIQAGSPNAQGTDGPGYVFPDEFSPTLRFSGPGVLAMANSGTNSNGSQFFITVASTPFLNDVHTIFGTLTGGTNVVIAISQVATNANSQPLTNVVIQNVSIRRVGTAAQAFDISIQNLPLVTNLLPKISNNGGQVAISFSNNLFADNRLYFSTNLSTWTSQLLGIENSLPVPNTLAIIKDAPSKFFGVAQIKYPSSTFAPKTLINRTLIFSFNTGFPGVITNNFDSVGGGIYFYKSGTNSSQGLTVYSWIQQPYRGYLSPILYSGELPVMALRLNFTGTAGGIFDGTASPDSRVSGTFILN